LASGRCRLCSNAFVGTIAVFEHFAKATSTPGTLKFGIITDDRHLPSTPDEQGTLFGHLLCLQQVLHLLPALADEQIHIM